jgi:hypothetical protein
MKPESARIWNPGGCRDSEERNNLVKISIPTHIFSLLATVTVSDVDAVDDESMGIRESSRTELDSHANMPVVGRHAFIISDTGRIADVNPFTPDYDSMQVPIVDAAVQYDCPYDGQSYILVVRNALHVPSMKNNLIPPFVLREAGVKVQDTPKIQVNEPSVDDHSILFPETGFRIPLSLWGTFSYFPTSKPTAEFMQGTEEVYLLTPSRWNPHCDAYATNEENMLDWEGNMIERRHRSQILLSDVRDDSVFAASVEISSVESNAIDALLQRSDDEIEEKVQPCWKPIPRQADEISSVLAGISPILNDQALYERLKARSDLGKFKASIGSTNATSSEFLVDDDDSATEDPTDSESEDDEQVLDDLFDRVTKGDLDLDEIMVSAAHAGKSKGIDAAHLSKIWKIDLKAAERTLDVTTQNSKRTDDPTLSRNYGTNDRMLRYKRIDEYFFMDTFFATKKAGKSSRSNTCCQLFVTDKGYVYVVPMKSKIEVLQAVKQFAKEIGAPDAIICDMAGEQTSQSLKKFCNEIGTTLRVLEEGTPWANKAELYIGLIKEAVRKDMKDSNCPLAFWDYCVERRARINNLTAKDTFKLRGSNAHSDVTGEEGDISNLCQYKWYDWCYFRDQKNKFPFNREVLGRVLGPAKGEGNAMAQWILKANGRVVPRRSLRPLKVDELHSVTELKKREIFDGLIERRWGTSINPPIVSDADSNDEFEEYEDENEQARIIPDIEDTVDMNGQLLNQQPAYDKILHSEVSLQLGEEMSVGRVNKRAIGPDGTVAGTYDENPYLNSMIYEVEFPDGQIKEYAANMIAENMLTQVDADGYSLTMMNAIIDYRKNEDVAIEKADMYVVTRQGRKRPRKTTVGWSLLVKWADESESWIPLKDMKESHPCETAEFAKARGIADEPAFAWWVPYTLRKRDVILSKVKARIRKTTHKYGIELPTSVKHSLEIDSKNGNTHWKDALAKEMTEVGVAFEVLDDGVKAPIGWSKVTGHLVWDVKMDFTRKARWVLDGHKTPDPVGSTYAGVVSRESVRIAFTYAALNGLDVFAADIRNAYLQAPSSQKDYIICGPEFGIENVGKVALIYRALYGGKAAGKDFRNHLRSCMRHLNFISCPADPDVWMRPAKRSDGSDYYEYILLYTDDILIVSENAEEVLRKDIGRYFALKEESIGPPKIYLGGSVRKVTLDNGVECWAFSSSQYVQAAVKNVEDYLSKRNDDKWKLPAKAETPMKTSYRPELDVSPELGPTEASYYMSLVGILRWIVELGRVDICLECSMMSSHMALPREGHLYQLFQVFAYLKKYHNTEMVFDPSDPVIDESSFEQRDWTSSEFGHLQGKEELPPNMPEPRGLGFIMRAKVDADHASDTVTRRSRTGFLVYLNCAPVYWSSKKQTSVESSSFGSEFVAMKQCCEYLRGLRYKLRMMGIPCEGPAYIQGDNQSVLANTTIPDSTLRKKNQSIAYHFVREGSARDEWRTTYVSTHDNDADLLTKLLPSGEKRKGFVRNILHHIFGAPAA